MFIMRVYDLEIFPFFFLSSLSFPPLFIIIIIIPILLAFLYSIFWLPLQLQLFSLFSCLLLAFHVLFFDDVVFILLLTLLPLIKR